MVKAKQNDINVAWSNESIELWFLIYFINLDAAIHRTDYIKKLNQIFTREGINGGRYEKNLKDIFEILSSNDRLYRAIERSKKLRENFGCKDIQPSKMNPCTTVDILVEELLEYISRTE
ncbi:MAG: RloB domain-containing protein [Clostridiaceae bacterium]|nr:RloB domain-containing protein [Clostridiaceae bacterium]